LTCSATYTDASNFLFTLTSTKASATVTDSVTGDININYWLNTGATADSSITYTAEISYWN